MNKQNELTINQDTRHHHLVEFCGNSLISFTGQTFVKTQNGKELIEFGDTIIKNDDGNFSLKKPKQ